MKNKELDSIYKLDISNIPFWIKSYNSNKEVVYKKGIVDNFTLYVDRVGKIKGYPGDDWYIDFISGRLITISEEDDKLKILPSGIIFSKDRLKKTTLSNAATACDYEEEYEEISEDFEFNSYICDKIIEESKEELLYDLFSNEIPYDLLCTEKDKIQTEARIKIKRMAKHK